MEAKRSMVRARRHGVTATKDHGAVVRPSQLIASVLRAMDMRRRKPCSHAERGAGI